MLWERSSYDDITILRPILDQKAKVRAGLPFYFARAKQDVVGFT